MKLLLKSSSTTIAVVGMVSQAVLVSSFSLVPSSLSCPKATMTTTTLWNEAEGGADYSEQQQQQDEDVPQSLVLDDIEQQMAKLRSKYPTSEADYLAAARARNAARVASYERQATDEDWEMARRAAQAQQGGQIQDDWDASSKEAGNADSQILIPTEYSSKPNSGEDSGDNNNDDPKLLLW